MLSSSALVGRWSLAGFLFLAGTFSLVTGPAAATKLSVTAEWDAARSNLNVVVAGDVGTAVTLRKAYDPPQVLGTGTVRRNGTWRTRISGSVPVPCRVRAESSQQSAERDVQNAPADCAPKGEGPDTEAPTVSIVSDLAGPIYASTQIVNIDADASDDVGVTKLELYYDGALQATDTLAPYSYD